MPGEAKELRGHGAERGRLCGLETHRYPHAVRLYGYDLERELGFVRTGIGRGAELREKTSPRARDFGGERSERPIFARGCQGVQP